LGRRNGNREVRVRGVQLDRGPRRVLTKVALALLLRGRRVLRGGRGKLSELKRTPIMKKVEEDGGGRVAWVPLTEALGMRGRGVTWAKQLQRGVIIQGSFQRQPNGP